MAAADHFDGTDGPSVPGDPSDPGGGDDNRRRHPRARYSVLLQYRFDTLDDFIVEYSADISNGGIFIHTTDVREIGTLVHFQFTLKDGATIIEGLGKVVRVKSTSEGKAYGMGIEFVNLDERSREMIQRIVKDHINRLPP